MDRDDVRFQRLEVVADERGLCWEALKTISAVAKIEHTSLRNAVLEEIVGMLRRINKPVYIAVKSDEK